MYFNKLYLKSREKNRDEKVENNQSAGDVSINKKRVSVEKPKPFKIGASPTGFESR